MAKPLREQGYCDAISELDSFITKALKSETDAHVTLNDIILYLHTMRLRAHTPTDANTITYEDFCDYAGIPYII